MQLDENRIDQRAARVLRILVDEIFRTPAIPPETTRDQHQQRRAEHETGFPFQARFSQDAFKAGVGHLFEAVKVVVAKNAIRLYIVGF
jgi:hypothetical protein